ncbi:MAG: ATP-binding protein [Desulforhabdus sp.]|jgi:MinD superfamily P-loop ATPase|nr:ATP-binding protein [Desulforhabdus sp.]
MIISIASGKGGTGKTTLATNLAVAIKREGVQLLDCDVEEPNAHLFLKPTLTNSIQISTEVPQIDTKLCTFCGLCQEICQFNAIAILPQVALEFPELCHSCGGCFLVCPESAVKSNERELGTVETGFYDSVEFVHGRLRVGEAMAPPLIRRVRKEINKDKVVIIDAPPGTSCPVIASLKDADFVVLVTEPTPFGLNDLELAVGAVRKLRIPMGIVVNRADLGDDRVHKFADSEAIPILLEIPFEREVAEAYAKGELLVERLPGWQERLELLFENIKLQVSKQRARP